MDICTRNKFCFILDMREFIQINFIELIFYFKYEIPSGLGRSGKPIYI